MAAKNRRASPPAELRRLLLLAVVHAHPVLAFASASVAEDEPPLSELPALLPALPSARPPVPPKLAGLPPAEALVPPIPTDAPAPPVLTVEPP